MSPHAEKKERSGREVLDALEASVAEVAAQIKLQKMDATVFRRRESDDARELYKALREAQRGFKEIGKSGFISGRNIPYAKINDLVDASRAALHAQNLVVSTYHTAYPNGFVTLVTRLYHVPSGQFTESELPLLNGTDEQKRGSSITYAWRYTYAPLIGLVDTSYDDDGEVTKR
jgi:hypothetical protein